MKFVSGYDLDRVEISDHEIASNACDENGDELRFKKIGDQVKVKHRFREIVDAERDDGIRKIIWTLKKTSWLWREDQIVGREDVSLLEVGDKVRVSYNDEPLFITSVNGYGVGLAKTPTAKASESMASIAQAAQKSFASLGITASEAVEAIEKMQDAFAPLASPHHSESTVLRPLLRVKMEPTSKAPATPPVVAKRGARRISLDEDGEV